LFALNGQAYLVTVDHYSDFYEIDQLPNIQSSAVIQATKQHFSRHGIPHTPITDNGAQYTSDQFKTVVKKYQFNHITSSPYWSQSIGQAEAAVKSAKHIFLTAEEVDLALLSVRNTPGTPILLLSACLDAHFAAICLSFQLCWSLSLLHVILS